jgi:hypothetical protein
VRALVLATVAAVLLLRADAPAFATPDSPSVRHRDAAYKYSVRLFDDWVQVPLETQGKEAGDPLGRCRVARYVQRDDKRGGQGGLEVFRLAKEAATTPSGTKPGKAPAAPAYASMDAVFGEILERMGGGFLPKDPKEARSVKSKDGVPGRMWSIDRPKRGFFAVAATWKKDDVEMGLWLVCDQSQHRKYERGFEQVVAQFTWFDDKAEELRSLSVLDGLPISPAKRREIEKGLLKTWDVIVSPKRNYVILYDRNGKRNDKLAQVVAERIEAIRGQTYEKQFPPAKPVKAVSIVRLCADAFGYHAYGGPPGTAGYWNDDAEELVFFDMDEKKSVADDDTLGVLYHEAFHQYIYYSVGEVAPHSWFNEGHGDYYAGSQYKDGVFTIKPFRWRVARVKNAIKRGPCPYEEKTKNGETTFEFDRSSEGYSPLKALTSMSQREYYQYPAISYAQGWSLVYFLREIVPKNKEYAAKWGRILDTYFDTLKSEVNKERPVAPKATAGGDKPAPGMGDAPAMGDTPPPSPVPPAPAAPTDPAMGEPAMSDPASAPVPAPSGEPGSSPPAGTPPASAPAPAPGPAPAPTPPPASDPGMGEPAMSDPPSEPGMSDPGMTDPGMSDPGMSDPGMTDPGMSDPAMGDPGMADPGMNDPGMDDGDDEPEPGIAAPKRREESAKALRAAVAAAFAGWTDADWAELEAAWKKEILKIPNPPRRH